MKPETFAKRPAAQPAAPAVLTSVPISTTWTFFEGDWHEGNVAIMGPRTHAAWLASAVFDGARAFEGVTPDLDLHAARVNASAGHMDMEPPVPVETWVGLAREGLSRFAPDAQLYIRPMVWIDSGIGGGVRYEPDAVGWCLCLYEAPLPKPAGVSITLSPYRRPTAESAPTAAKAACLYPNNSRALIEAHHRGFDNCLLRDALGNIAELGNANVFMAKGGVVYTPVANGTFLSGITRRRVVGLLRGAGIEVVETTLTYADFETADEIFTTGNYSKVAPITRIDDRRLPIGPISEKARRLYWDFAHG